MSNAAKLLAEVLNLSDVPADARLGHPPEWDSLAHMHLVLALEARTGQPLSPMQIVSLVNLNEIDALLRAADADDRTP